MTWLLLLMFIMPALARQMETYVVGGMNADIINHPYQLSLRVTGSHSCGASIINANNAVTAAHCVGGPIATYTILGGSTDRTVTDCALCVTRTMASISVHPDYSDSGAVGLPNDVAVLGFAAVSQSAAVQYITMAAPTDGDLAGKHCNITGWGRTTSISGLPTMLQWADMTVMTKTACETAWSTTQINDGHICVTDDVSSTCNGDSGGALVCAGLLAGSASWGASNCSPSNPSVFTRISFFKAWIDAVVNVADQSCC